MERSPQKVSQEHDRPWRLSLFDQWSLSRGSAAVHLPRREQRLLAFLAISPPRPRVVVAGELWPDSNDAHALSNLRSALLRVRHEAPGLLGDHGDALGLHEHTQVDLTEKLQAARGPGDPLARAATLLPCGELLPGWYDDWVVSFRERMRHKLIGAFDALAEELLQCGESRLALELAECSAEHDPFRETSHRILAMIHLDRGDKVEAFRTYQSFRRRSIEEFGMAPTEQFEDIVADLLSERRSRRRAAPARVPVARDKAPLPPLPLPVPPQHHTPRSAS